MSKEFFNRRIPDEKWKDLRKEAVAYDELAQPHVHGLDTPLTNELLFSIAGEKKRERLAQTVRELEDFVENAHKMLTSPLKDSEKVEAADKKFLELKASLSLLEDELVRRPSPKNPIKV